ncbi:2Fe-2S iron-sulfur cluster-binding protein [Bacillus sp. FJAT-45350]|uniref:2Fe-2S iron-sulfur cluster-binding protein n=1 Tax=Bacillus sp. FJAT-45350 TaxID=2011014 RepID=UPI000BB8211A|nr:2Fe-2S iron-sulfur cluster-binding protein [Bacillus sp. FJAT-45350]
MPHVKLHKHDDIFEGDVKQDANLVVLAGIKQFPHPHLSYGCGMGKCTKCATIIVNGAEKLNPPNWKEEKMLGDKLKEGYRLTCQLTISDDIELEQK